jgi:uncharacterized protein (DUF924 family)
MNGMSVEPPLYVEIVEFWRVAGAKRWFKRDPTFDDDIRERFEPLHHAAARGEFDHWAETPEGALALVLLLDQFPRNLYRGSAHAYAADGLARRIAAVAVNAGVDQAVEPALRVFFYMPFEHSEAAADQARSVQLFEAHGDEDYARFARLHAEIIDRFGRFPHRNAALGRDSTPEEIAFLKDGGFKG